MMDIKIMYSRPLDTSNRSPVITVSVTSEHVETARFDVLGAILRDVDRFATRRYGRPVALELATCVDHRTRYDLLFEVIAP